MQEPIDEKTEAETAAANGGLSLKFAPAWKRAAAFFVDLAIITALFMVVYMVVYRQEFEQIARLTNFADQWKQMQAFLAKEGLRISVARFFLEAAYFCAGWVFSAATPGAKLFKIAVISADSRRLNWLESMLRYGMISLISFLFWLPAVFVFNPIYRQRIMDVLVNSVVVEMPEGGWPEMKQKENENDRDDRDDDE